MTESGDPDVGAILELFEAGHAEEAPDPNEGLRERKKRRVRQKISDVATAMILVHGFDKVTVAQIAAACEVAEQTLFNYFPNKESMFFDRSESLTMAVSDAVRERRSASLVEAVLQALTEGIPLGRSEAHANCTCSGSSVTSPLDRRRSLLRDLLILFASQTKCPSRWRNASARTRLIPRYSSPHSSSPVSSKSDCSRPSVTFSTRPRSPPSTTPSTATFLGLPSSLSRP
jgi:AcrR family transcriptional regulator